MMSKGTLAASPHFSKRRVEFYPDYSVEFSNQLNSYRASATSFISLTWWTRPFVSPVLYTGQWTYSVKTILKYSCVPSVDIINPSVSKYGSLDDNFLDLQDHEYVYPNRTILSTCSQNIGVYIAGFVAFTLKNSLTCETCIMDTWYDADSNSRTLYSGKIEKKKKRNGVYHYIVAYWKPDEDAEDTPMTKFELGADLISGNSMYCNC
ncbi:hypothetical protein GQR58_006255 [Nymphon striatum]|nr:hypothetical protein GQR58_006255 [Nymphon striatum]